MTPFEEGRLAGYRDEPNVNPYRQGAVRLGFAVVEAAGQWDAGYQAGQEQGHADVLAKHLDGCR